MARQDNRRSQQGLLLVEAILSAVVIGVGLVFVTRSFASQLKALQTVEVYDTLLSLAQAKLAELEAQRQARPDAAIPPQGAFDASQQTGRCHAPEWEVTAAQQGAEEAAPSEIVLSVRCGEGSSASISVSALWPTERVPASWF